MSDPTAWMPARVAGVIARHRSTLVQLLRFGTVGGVGFLVDAGVFTLLRVTVFAPDRVHGGPLYAKVVSVALAILVNWIGNRLWTFRDNRRTDVVREAMEFALASLLGSAVSLGCLALSHYALHLTTTLDDNISANVVGLVLGSALRFAIYRWWVYGERRMPAPVPASASAVIAPSAGAMRP